MSQTPSSRTGWWGTFDLRVGAGIRWRIGPLELWALAQTGECELAYRRGDDPLDARLEMERVAAEPELPEGCELRRFAWPDPEGEVSLIPLTADRPVIVRPETPFALLGDDEAVMYVSTPVWVRVETGGEGRTLLDIPAYRPSDTWFGSPVGDGELGYASRTRARVRLDAVGFVPARAMTEVTIRNHASDTFVLERVAVPTPALRLFADMGGMLWTSAVTVEREVGGETARVRVADHPPQHATGWREVTPPREPETRNVIARALGAFLGSEKMGGAHVRTVG